MEAESFRERLEIYLDSIRSPLPEPLEALEREALLAGVPIVRRDTLRTLRMLLALGKPGTILEIGTAVGFSSAFFCALTEAEVVTVELDAGRAAKAKEHFHELGLTDRITLLEGDAAEILPSLEGSFDMIFLDGAKGQYVLILPELLRLLKNGGMLVTDNVLQGGGLLSSHYAVERRNRTIYKRMREFMREIMEREGLETTVLPVGDGLAVTVKR